MKNLLKKIICTQAGIGVSLTRIVIGIIFFKAGSGKLFGWFGGYGIQAVSQFFTDLKIPYPLFNAYLVGCSEFLCGIGLVVGLLTRLAVIPLSITMIVAIFTAHKEGDFYYPLVILTTCITLFETGGGLISFDRLIVRSKT